MKKITGKIEKAELSLEIVRQPVPFKEEGVMHSLRVSKQSVISFDKLAYHEMEVRGVRPALARMVAEELGDALRSWLSAGHAVNITGVGTLRPVVNSKAHVRPHDEVHSKGYDEEGYHEKRCTVRFGPYVTITVSTRNPVCQGIS